MKKTFPKSSTAEILEFINENIKKHKLKKNEDYRASLMTEETLVLITEHASGDEITVGISYIDGVLRIRMIAAGEPFDLLEAAVTRGGRDRAVARRIEAKHAER